MVDECWRSGKEGVVFKLDFQSACDHMDWDLDSVCGSCDASLTLTRFL